MVQTLLRRSSTTENGGRDALFTYARNFLKLAQIELRETICLVQAKGQRVPADRLDQYCYLPVVTNLTQSPWFLNTPKAVQPSFLHWFLSSGKTNIGTASNAPMSQAPSLRGNPRWSVAGHAALSPASMAMLGDEIDSVIVGPPLLARTPSTRDGTLCVIIPGPNPIATHVPSLTIGWSPTAVIPLPEQS